MKKNPGNGFVTVHLSHPQAKLITIPYQIAQQYAVRPKVRQFTTISSGKSATAHINIISNYGEQFELDSIQSEKGTVNVTNTTKLTNGYQLQLQMNVPQDNKQRIHKDYLLVQIKDDTDSILRILCYSIATRQI